MEIVSMIGKLEMVETYGVADVFVTGLGTVEHIGGGNWRFTFFVSQKFGGNPEMVVAAKIIMPAGALQDAMHLTAITTEACACLNLRTMTRN